MGVKFYSNIYLRQIVCILFLFIHREAFSQIVYSLDDYKTRQILSNGSRLEFDLIRLSKFKICITSDAKKNLEQISKLKYSNLQRVTEYKGAYELQIPFKDLIDKSEFNFDIEYDGQRIRFSIVKSKMTMETKNRLGQYLAFLVSKNDNSYLPIEHDEKIPPIVGPNYDLKLFLIHELTLIPQLSSFNNLSALERGGIISSKIQDIEFKFKVDRFNLYKPSSNCITINIDSLRSYTLDHLHYQGILNKLVQGEYVDQSLFFRSRIGDSLRKLGFSFGTFSGYDLVLARDSIQITYKKQEVITSLPMIKARSEIVQSSLNCAILSDLKSWKEGYFHNDIHKPSISDTIDNSIESFYYTRNNCNSALLDQFMKIAPRYQGIVYRGGESGGKRLFELLSKKGVGDTFSFGTDFIATSAVKHEAERFEDVGEDHSILFVISCTNACYLDFIYSIESHEEEFLLRGKKAYQITKSPKISISQGRKKIIVYLKEPLPQ